MSQQDEFVTRIDKGALFIDTLIEEEGFVYGVTTGYGDSCTVSIPLALVDELPKHLYTFTVADWVNILMRGQHAQF